MCQSLVVLRLALGLCGLLGLKKTEKAKKTEEKHVLTYRGRFSADPRLTCAILAALDRRCTQRKQATKSLSAPLTLEDCAPYMNLRVPI